MLFLHVLLLTASISPILSTERIDILSDVQLLSALSGRFPQLLTAPATMPQQLRLAPGPLPGASMRVSWATLTAVNATMDGVPHVTWWPVDLGPGASVSSISGGASTYSAGEGGWSGALYTAIMSPLLFDTVYAYTVGTLSDVSDIRTFSMPPRGGAPARLAFAADMGTIVPLGWSVSDRLVEDHLAGAGGRYDAVVLGGDLSYSTVSPGSCSTTNPGCDSLEFVWDFFGIQIEPYSSTASLLSCVGNHEHVPGNITHSDGTVVKSDFAAYEARFPMPSDTPTGGELGFWYSTNVGVVHLIFLSSEHPAGSGSAQMLWAVADLNSVNFTETPWIIAVIHRPIYSAALLEWADHSPGGPLSLAWEPLFLGRVDVVLSGHIHSFDRTHPVYNGSVLGPLPPTNSSVYIDPVAPLYVCAGTSGALPENVFIEPPPVWSAVRHNGVFGYGRLEAAAASAVESQQGIGEHVLNYTQLDLFGEVVDWFQVRKKASRVSASAPISLGLNISILEYGGVGDGATDNSVAFVHAVAAIVAAGGGTLNVPAGRFLTGPVNLTSHLTLVLAPDATLLGGVEFDTWLLVSPLPSFPGDGPRYAPLLGGLGISDVRVTGGGTIDAQGLVWYAANHALKGQRPHAIEFNNATRIELDSVTIVNSAFWTVHPVYCTSVYIHDITIINSVGNGDGIDPDGSEDVLIERVSINTADDAIAIKSGTAPPSGMFPPSRNVTIRDSVLASGEACVAIGSEMTAGVENIVIGPNVSCVLAGHGLLYIKERQADGGYVRNVTVYDSRITGPVSRFLWLSQHFGEHGENVADVERGYTIGLPQLANVSITNITLGPSGYVLEAAILNGARVGTDGGITGLSLKAVHLGSPLIGWTCANASGQWVDVVPRPCSEILPVPVHRNGGGGGTLGL
jgi:hypothetical protein